MINTPDFFAARLFVVAGFALLTGCSSPRLPASSPYPIIAEVNKERWYGNVQAVQIRSDPADPCTQDKFLLYAYTDLPYRSDVYRDRFEKPTGCLGDCSKTQSLLIDFIPLKKGKHKFHKLDVCYTGKRKHAYFAYLLPRTNSGVVRAYYREARRNNWIKITRYDAVNREIEGVIRMTLVGDMNEDFKGEAIFDKITFRKAVFKAKLTKLLDLGKLKPPGGGED
nr:hypothetical protein [uncultured Arsenicibacter sp.]